MLSAFGCINFEATCPSDAGNVGVELHINMPLASSATRCTQMPRQCRQMFACKPAYLLHLSNLLKLPMPQSCSRCSLLTKASQGLRSAQRMARGDATKIFARTAAPGQSESRHLSLLCMCCLLWRLSLHAEQSRWLVIEPANSNLGQECP